MASRANEANAARMAVDARGWEARRCDERSQPGRFVLLKRDERSQRDRLVLPKRDERSQRGGRSAGGATNEANAAPGRTDFIPGNRQRRRIAPT